MAAVKEEEDDDEYYSGYGLFDDSPDTVITEGFLNFDNIEGPKQNLWNELTHLEPEKYENLDDMLRKEYKGKIKNLQHKPKRPMVVGFHHFRMHYYDLKKWTDIFYEVALTYEDDDVTFAVGDFKDGKLLGFEWVERMYNSIFTNYEYSSPWLYAVDAEERKYDCLGFVTVENVSEYANKLHNGTIYTSEPIPPPDESAKTLVKVAVADNFDQLVWQNEKDVFLILYASYCHFSGELLETAAELAKLIKDENIEIVQMNFEKNYTDINLLKGYSPICYFIPRMNKNSKIMYDLGPRTIENLAKFLAINTTDEMKHFDRDGKSK